MASNLNNGGGRASCVDLAGLIRQNFGMLIHPSLLKVGAIRRPTRIFLCGPGAGGANYEIREFARKTLEGIENTEVIYGEEIENIHAFKRKRKDLQTLEAELAHSVDFTLLLLESPGSMAELGTFSMINNLRGRLVVLVPSQFYGDASYIARGPLSLLSRSFQQNVIYFDRVRDEALKSRILYPLTFYKFSNFRMGYRYVSHLATAYKKADYGVNDYESFIEGTREEFATAATLIAILILGNPTFPELVASTALTPDQSSSSLARLFEARKIEKVAGGRYSALAGYDDTLLDAFSSTAISDRRACWIADLDTRSVR